MATLDLLGGVPVINAIGTPRTIGDTLGQRLKPRLQVLTQYLKEQLASAIHEADPARASNDLSVHLKKLAIPLARTEPTVWMEIESISRATDIPEEDLLLVHGWNDLLSHYGSQAPHMRSSYLALPPSHTDTGMSRSVFAWHLDPTLFPYITLVRRMPSHGPASICLTLAGLQPIAGISEAGLAIACNELRVSDGTQGHFTSHLFAAALNSPTFEDALNRLKKSPRHGGGAMHLLSGTGQRATIELSGQETAILNDPVLTSPRVHTNHALDGEIMRWGSRYGDSSSKDRLAFLAGRAVEARACDPDFISTWFGIGRSVAMASDSNLQQGNTGLSPDTTVLMIMDPGRKALHVRRGGSPARLESMQF